MKSYAIYDNDLNRTDAIGYLFYYEGDHSFVIELNNDLSEWEAPLLFQGIVRNGNYTISKEVSLMWVKERIIPSGRQNIGLIMKNHHLKTYNEIDFLILSKGKCSQDNCYIEEIDYELIPENIQERMKKNLCDSFPTEDNQIICMFQNNEVKKVNLNDLLKKYGDLKYVLKNRQLLKSMRIGAGGYSVIFTDSIEIQARDLYLLGQSLPITKDDFMFFVQRNVVDVNQSCEILECTRQNMSYLIKKKKISPVKSSINVNLYLKGEVEQLKSE